MIPVNGSSVDYYRLFKAIEAERFAEAEKERLAAGIRSQRQGVAPGRIARLRALLVRRERRAEQLPAIRRPALTSAGAARHPRQAA